MVPNIYGSEPDLNVPLSPEDSLTLEDCIEISLMNSYQIIQARDNVTLSEFNLRDSRAEFLPRLNLSGGYQVSDQNDQVAWNDDHYSLTLSGSITAFNGGKNILNLKKSSESLFSTRQGYLLSEINVIIDVITKYYNLLETFDLMELSIESLNQKRRDLEFARIQFELGLSPEADNIKAEVEVINAQIDSLKNTGEVDLAETELKDAMGISLEFPLRIKQVALFVEESPELDSCLEEALEARPEVWQEKSNLSIKKYDLRLAQINKFPSLSITGSYNVFADDYVFGGTSIDGDNWETNSNWEVGLGLSFPIFYGGKYSRAVKSAKINLSNAELEYKELEKEIELEVKQTHLNLLTALKKIELTEKQVASAELNYNTAQGMYQTGVAPITDVIDAGIALNQSKINYTNAMYEYLLIKAKLKKAIGERPY
ncbi:TolC family protein [bacterium]|nr:TolC family protein [bacterium]